MTEDINGKRYYEVGDELFPSVTNILSIISKGQYFDKWLANNSADDIQKKSNDALNLGTRIHAHCESIIKARINGSQYFIDIKEDEQPAMRAFIDFENKYRPRFLSSEIFLYSKKHKYAGTCDIIAEINGKLCLLDIKTSKSVYNTMGLQLSAYAQAYKEIFKQKIQKLYILRLDKEKGIYQFKEYPNELHIFLHALKLYNWSYPCKKLNVTNAAQ